MSKKHFEALAKKFAEAQPFVPQGEDVKALTSQELRDRVRKHEQWHNDVVIVADVCASFAPAFNRTRFYIACGIDGGK